MIETTFAVIILIVTVAMAASLSLELRQEFKHNYLPPAEGVPLLQDEIAFRKDLVLFDFRSQTKQESKLIGDGWVSRELKIPRQAHFKIFEKNNKELLLIDNLGVISCLKNCGK